MKSLQRAEQGVGRFPLADAVAVAGALGRTVDHLVSEAAEVEVTEPVMGRPRDRPSLSRYFP